VRRRHAPLLLVHRLAQVIEVRSSARRPRCGAGCRASRHAPPSMQCSRALLRIADLVADQVQLSSAAFLVASLSRAGFLMSSPRDFSRASYQLVHAGLGSGWKILLYQSWPTASPNARSVKLRALLPARRRFLLSRQRLPKKGKVLIEEGLGKVLRRTVQRVPAESTTSTPRSAPWHQFAQPLEEIRRSHIQRLKGAYLHVLEVDRVIEIRGQLLEVGHRIDVVAILGWRRSVRLVEAWPERSQSP